MQNKKECAGKILVVDDDVDFVEQLKLQLEREGYEVITADSLSAAEKIIDREDIDAAIVDLMLEYADGGFVLCYKLKNKNANLPVIIVTSVASEMGIDFDASTEEERQWVKADLVLTKPVRFEQLKFELARLLRRRAGG